MSCQVQQEHQIDYNADFPYPHPTYTEMMIVICHVDIILSESFYFYVLRPPSRGGPTPYIFNFKDREFLSSFNAFSQFKFGLYFFVSNLLTHLLYL